MPTKPLALGMPRAIRAANFVIVTLLVAWALENTIYFSLFVGIPVGSACGVLTFVVLRKYLRDTHTELT